MNITLVPLVNSLVNVAGVVAVDGVYRAGRNGLPRGFAYASSQPSVPSMAPS
eukprot:SAG31_NODE_29905_length_388_cov_0.889273_1_plen_51_part_10